jgi:hypothetical protein
MNFSDTIRASLAVADFVANSMLGDLSEEELMLRPAPEANHVAWQLGHLITSECRLVAAAAPGREFALPEGFAERHATAAAQSDNPADFFTKDEYLTLGRQVRENTLAALSEFSDADADRPVAGKLPPFVKRAGDAFAVIGPHWSAHAGQWAVLRRKLSRPRMF